MLSPEGYGKWTAAFSEGSHYVGSWEQGAKIKFLGQSGEGMISEIAENRPLEFVSIRHLGMFENGVEDTTSEKVRAWAPAYENYKFSDVTDGCHVVVTLDTASDGEQRNGVRSCKTTFTTQVEPMSRPLRVELAGSTHHVTSCGRRSGGHLPFRLR